MKAYAQWLFIAFLLSTCSPILAKTAITFKGGGRLGDQLMNYYKAKWFSYKYDIPFYCPDFPFKDELMLSQKEPRYKAKMAAQFSKIQMVFSDADIKSDADDTLYISTIHAKPAGLHSAVDTILTLNQHPQLLKHLRSCIAPCNPVKSLAIPTDRPTIAVHVRRGGGFDQPLLHNNRKKEIVEYADKKWPTRFAPDEYYIEQIKRIIALIGNQPIYIHIFTDDKHPGTIAKRYKKAVGLPYVTFGYRKKNEYKGHVLEDLFAMTQFNYLIRSTSNFSLMASILGNHKLIVWPKHATWYDDYLVIDRIWVVERHEDGTMTKEALDTSYSNYG